MSEIINLDYNDLKSMSEEALDFFVEELRNKNTVSVNTEDGSIHINSPREWDEFLKKQNLWKSRIQKDVRI